MDPMWTSRAVIVHRDENGYGLTVSGDRPVSVQKINRGGAAELAGIREGDVIVKVNGTLVERMTHTEVVAHIKSAGPYVTLTVKPPPLEEMPSVGFLGGGNSGRPHPLSAAERVTAPLPVNQEVQLKMQGSKLRTLQLMRDKAAGDVEKLWKKYEQTSDPRDMTEFEKAQQGLKKIESQMKSLRQSTPNLQLHSPVPFSQLSQGHHSVPFQPYAGYQQQMLTRNRNPLSVQSTMPTYQNLSQCTWMEGDNPPPLPPRSISQNAFPAPEYPPSPMMGYSSHSSPSSSNSSFNNHTGHGHTHFQSPTNNTHEMLSKTSNSSGTSGFHGHNQQQQTHHRAKSSPDPVSMQKVLNACEGSKRSDSFSDLSKNINSRSRSSGAWDSVDSNHLSPPGSPPPPYGKFTLANDHENNFLNIDIHPSGNANISSSDPSGPVQLTNRANQFSASDIIAMEEDDGLYTNEPITVPSISGFHGPYSSLSRLLEHNAHLAVFINYVIDNRRDPSSLLFYLITGIEIEEGNLKEMKRWGYEIHSTFTAPGSPLLVPHVDENIATEIDDALLNEVDKEEMMRRVFRKARNKAKEEINKQLEEFCNKRTAGLGSMYGPPDNQLDESLQDKVKELKIVENYLVPRVEQFNVEVEKNSDGRIFAIMVAVVTVIFKLFGLRNHPSVNSILEKHGSFVSKDKSMRSRFISKPKKITHNGHHFVLQFYSSYTECNACSKLLWGIGPQGHQCVDCNINVHRSHDTYRTHNCLNEIQESCLGANQKKDKTNDKFRRFKEKIRPGPDKDPKKRNSSIIKKPSDDSSHHPMYGDESARRLSGEHLPSSSTSGSVEHSSSSGGIKDEDFYEFPTSTKLQSKYPSSSEGSSEGILGTEKGIFHQKKDSSSKNSSDSAAALHKSDLIIEQRKRLSGIFDILDGGKGGSRESPKNAIKAGQSVNLVLGRPLSGSAIGQAKVDILSPELPPRGLAKSNSVLSSSSSSSITSSSTSFASPSGSNPVSRSSSGGKDISRSVFYVPPLLPPKGTSPSPSTLLSGSASKKPPPPPPPKWTAEIRPHSWADLGSQLGKLSLHQDFLHHSRNRRSAAAAQPNPVEWTVNGCKVGSPINCVGPPVNHKRSSAPLPMAVALAYSCIASTNPSQHQHHHPPNLTRIKKPLGSGGSSTNNLKVDRRPGTLSEERLTSDGLTFEDGEAADRIHSDPKKPSTAVGRSESCKERVQRKPPRERRKHSDPNLTSKSNDVDLDNQRQLSDANNSGSSSNSSLSARYHTSLDSPSTSLELVAPSNNSSSSLRNAETSEITIGHSGGVAEPFKLSSGWDGDSDIEIEQDPPDWTKNVPEEKLNGLNRLEKKRQEVLNELFHTERSHVRNLKVVDRLFYRPIRHQQFLSENLIQMLFANLEDMLEIHGRLNSALKKLRAESPLVGDIGPVLLEMFDGEGGRTFKQAAATFCAKQQIGLEGLRDRRRKDLKFNAFLTEAESDAVCRRLGIKDMIPMAMQRLTKYPLLFENLCNCTPSDTEEYKSIQRAVELSKEILCHVNFMKKEAEDLERLIEIQRKLDKVNFDKGIDKSDKELNEIRNIEFPRHRLIYEGSLMWRTSKTTKQKTDLQEVQAVLLHDMIVILLKQDDRYVLKMHNLGLGKAEKMLTKPVIKLNNLHHRPVATDKRAFFLISTTSSVMYELVCSTAEERNIWFHHITKAADDYKNRQESRRSELQSVAHIPASFPEIDEKIKESIDVTEETTPTTTGIGDASAAVELHDSSTKNDGIPKVHKEASPAPDNPNHSEPNESPDNSTIGDDKLSVGSKLGRSFSASPCATRRKQGEFLRVTESSPLVNPSEVVVTTRDVQFAQSVISPYEELKRADTLVHRALEEKVRIASKIFNIPAEMSIDVPPEPGSSDETSQIDAKQLVASSIQQVDQLVRIVSSQKCTADNLEMQRQQQLIHKNLTCLLTQIMSEISRKDEEIEARRQELHRVREQNHGYLERLQSRIRLDSKEKLSETSPASPPLSRPSSFLSASTSSEPQDLQQPDENSEVVMSIPSKLQLSVPAASSSSNVTSTTNTANPDDKESPNRPTSLNNCSNGGQRSSSELTSEEFADAVEDQESSDLCLEADPKSTEGKLKTTPCVGEVNTNELVTKVEEFKTDEDPLIVPDADTSGNNVPKKGSLTNGHTNSTSPDVDSATLVATDDEKPK